ncbi:PAS-domain containing protein [Desertibaculum subflavum]|uniref:PAS-domain containing protein n=1 Tax=Desertibaculum subflavum TaxID=2268458 RepID=UPI000E65F16A
MKTEHERSGREEPRAETAAAARERQYQWLVENTDEILFQLDAEGRLLFANPAGRRVLGYPGVEVVGRSALDLVDAGARQAAADALARHAATATDEALRLELPVTARDGGRRILDVRARSTRGPDGRLGFVCTARDVTAQREAERQLRESEERFRDFAETASDWFWEQDQDLRFTYASGGHQMITGLGLDYLRGRTRDELFGIDMAPGERARHADDLANRRPFVDLRYVHRMADGSRRHVSVSGKPVFDAVGSFRGYRGTGRDITAMVDAQHRASETMRLLEAAYTAIPDGITVIGPNGELRASNDQAFAVLGLDQAKCLAAADPVRAMLTEIAARGEYGPGQVAEHVERRMAMMLSGRVIQSVRQRADGRWIDVRGFPMADGGRVTVYRDVTEERAAAAALAEKTEMLDASFKAIPDGITVLGPDQTLRAANDQIFAVMGLDKEKCLAAPDPLRAMLTELALRGEYGPGDLNALVEQRLELMRGRDPLYYLRRQTTGRWIEVRGIPMPQGGRVTIYRDITEEKAAQTSLAEKTRVLDATFELMPDGVMVTDAEQRLLAANDRAFEILGVDKVRCLAAPDPVRAMIEEIALRGEYGPGTVEEHLARRAAIMRERRPQQYQRQRRDGRWVEGRGVPMADGGWIAMYRDITEEKASAAALAERTGALDAMFRLIPDGIHYIGGDGKVRAVNDKLFEILRVDRERCLAAPDISRAVITEIALRGEYGPGSVEEHVATRMAGMLSGRPQHYERQRTDGGWFEARGIPTADGGMITIYRDITEEKAAAAALAEKTRVLDAVFALLPEGVKYHDADLRIRAVNDRFFEILGLDKEQVMAAPDPMREIVRQMAARGEYGSGELERITHERLQMIRDWDKSVDIRQRADGRWTESWAIRTKDGGLVSVYRDITETKRREQELERARELAEAASRAKSEFLAMMSHEIRTPMNGVIGMIDELLATPLDPRQRSAALVVRESGEALLRILNDILDFSRLEAGRLELETAPFDLRLLVERTLGIVRPRAATRGLALHATIRSDVPKALRGDRGRLRQVLLNLLGNAVKFTEAGSVTLGVYPEAGTDGAPVLRFEVTDTGVGVAEDLQPRLFSAFVQADAGTARRFGGSGLGLAISKRIVDLMGGAIGMASRPGHGSTFWFTMPMTAVPTGELGPGTAEEEVSAETRRRLDGYRVLVVEDNETNALVAESLLKRLGATVDLARDGEEAVAAAGRRRFDAILMDVNMPVMNGLAATRAIRALGGENGWLPIIACTANAFGEDVEACRAAGMDDFLAKPFSATRLASVLLRNLGQHDAGEVPPMAPSPADVAAAPPIVDRAALTALRQDVGLEAVEDLVAGFLVATRQRLDLLRGLCAAGARDDGRQHRELHSQKSSARLVGAAALAALAAELERRLETHAGRLEAVDLDRMTEALAAYEQMVARQGLLDSAAE